MGRSNSRSRSSRSKSRSRSSSRSRSRSHSRKKRYSSRSRSRTYSRSRSRERMYSRDSRDSRDMRDMRDNRDYHRDFRNNRGMRRPYGFRPMRRGFFPGGGGGRFMHRGGFRPMWNRRHSRSPRRGRSRSRTPKRRSVSSQRSRSRSRRSYRSSRSPMSSSSGSSSQYSNSPPIRTKKHVSREKKAKKSRTAPVHDSPLNIKSHDEPKDTFERDPSESLDEFSKASGVCGDTWAGLSAYDNSPGTPQSPSLVASPSSLSSSDSDTPILSTAKEPSSPRLHSIQHSPESVNNGSARYSPSQNSPLHHIQSKKSPAKTTSAEESRTGELEPTKGGKGGKRPLHKMVSKEKSSFREESPFGIKMVASEAHHPEVKLKMTTVPLEADRSTSLLNDRLLASTLVHSVNKDQEFRSIFDHLELPQSGKTSSESFIEHIVSLVHYVQEHCFKSSGITLHERFGGYQKAAEEQAARQKSPEIHRRIDISPSALKKHTRLAGEEKTFKEMAPKTDKKLKIASTDKRHEVERRRKQRSKERGNSKGSRESSSSRKQDKLQKEFKEFKLFKEESKLKNKEKERSQSTSSSFSSPENKSGKKEREEDFRIQQEQKEYSGFAGVSRPRGTFFRIRGRGRARGLFAGTNAGPITLNPPPFPKRPPEEEWDPEYTPKSKKYFLHDDRDDGVDYWANRGRSRGTFQRGRGRFTFKKSGSSPKWTHDKYQGDGLLEDEEEAVENNEERMDIHKEEKVDHSGLSVN